VNGIADCVIENVADVAGNPTGGSVEGIGLKIEWQNGPLGRGEDRKEPNGAFVETVISAAKQRLEYFERSKFACRENAAAIGHLDYALMSLERRTRRREQQGTEGRHVEDNEPARHPAVAELLQFFTYAHLPLDLATASAPFCTLAQIVAAGPGGAETTVALRKLLEAKDAAVRAVIADRNKQGGKAVAGS